jgi:hypothetical protein
MADIVTNCAMNYDYKNMSTLKLCLSSRNMIDKTMCEVLWRNIYDFYLNLRVEVAAVSRNNILWVSTVFSTPYLFLDTAARLQWPVTQISRFQKFFHNTVCLKIVRYGGHCDELCNELLIFESDEYFPHSIRHLNFQKSSKNVCKNPFFFFICWLKLISHYNDNFITWIADTCLFVNSSINRKQLLPGCRSIKI